MKTATDQKLFDKIAGYSTKTILNVWDETEKILTNKETYFIRGSIMDVLKVRHPKEFENWINADYPNDNINIHFKGCL